MPKKIKCKDCAHAKNDEIQPDIFIFCRALQTRQKKDYKPNCIYSRPRGDYERLMK
jgi:hypothetical protein